MSDDFVEDLESLFFAALKFLSTGCVTLANLNDLETGPAIATADRWALRSSQDSAGRFIVGFVGRGLVEQAYFVDRNSGSFKRGERTQEWIRRADVTLYSPSGLAPVNSEVALSNPGSFVYVGFFRLWSSRRSFAIRAYLFD